MNRRAWLFTTTVGLLFAVFHWLRNAIGPAPSARQTDALTQRLRQLEAEAASLRGQRDANTRELAESGAPIGHPCPNRELRIIPGAPGQRAENQCVARQSEAVCAVYSRAAPDQRIPEMIFAD